MKLNGRDFYLSLLQGKSFVHKGEFDATEIYFNTNTIIDCVLYNGASYYCKKTTTEGILPTNAEYWGVMSSRGEQGIQGEKGEKGDKGDKGDTGEKGETGQNGAGVYVNGVASEVNFKSDPQTQLDEIKAEIGNVSLLLGETDDLGVG